MSSQSTPNANLQIDPEETSVAIQQASRFSEVCKVYAPMYRQRTLTALLNQVDSPEIRAIAYGDAGSRAGEPTKENQEVLCVNPASLSGGSGPLKTYFYVAATTPARWEAFLDLYTGRCESSGGINWLQVDTTNIVGDKRPTVSQTLGPTWGLHLYDVNLALGNLVDLVRQQAAAFSR